MTFTDSFNTKTICFLNYNPEPFYFGNDLLDITPKFDNQPLNIAEGSYLVSHTNILKNKTLKFIYNKDVYQTQLELCSVYTPKILHNNDLVIIKVSHAIKRIISYKITNTNLIISEFKRNLLCREFNWCKQFFTWIFEHLNKRFANNHILTHLDLVQNKIAKILENLQKISYLMNKNTLITADELRISKKLILSTCHNLAQMAGGRAFLANNVIDMLWLYTVFNNIYFHEAVNE